MTLIKICGLTREEDVQLADTLGADFVGFIFVPSSPRFVTRAPRTKRRAKRVGVFRDAPVDEMNRIADEASLDFIQLHGNESEDVIQALTRPVIKAVHVTDHTGFTTSAGYLLFDTGGGTGKTFDWTLLANHARTTPFFVAGGITPENASEAIRVARPDGIDCSSGIESAPGIKDHDKLRRLFEKVRPQ